MTARNSPEQVRRLRHRSTGGDAWMLWKGMLRVLDEHHRGGRRVRRAGFASDLARLGATAARGVHHDGATGRRGVRVRLDLLIRLAGLNRGGKSRR